MNRRTFLTQAAALAAATTLPRGLGAATASLPSSSVISAPRGKAEHCIFLWLGGGMSQIDTFDPKKRGNSKSKPAVPGTDYDVIDTVILPAAK